jgi:hypothetical protein
VTTLAIMQPTYLPWMGYFDLIDQADHFIFLNDVQLSRQSWQTRNRIRGTNGRELMLSIPIQHIGGLGQMIRDVKVDDQQKWRKKHARSLQQAYARAPYGNEASSLWCEFLSGTHEKLVDVTQSAITKVCSVLDITTQLSNSDDYPANVDRIDRLIALCRAVHADTYLSPAGAAGYLAEADADRHFSDAGIELRFQTYTQPHYNQGKTPFLSNLGIIDLLAHEGYEQALPIIRSGRDTERAQHTDHGYAS